jgi:hypothetical protein
MTAGHGFERIIRPEGDEKIGKGQVLIVVNLETREVVQARFGTSLFKKYARLLVCNAQNPDAYADDGGLEVSVKDDERDQPPLQLAVSYRAVCNPGDEERFALAVAGAKDVSGVVRHRLERWINEFARKDVQEFVDRYAEKEPELRREIKAMALRQLGLTLTVLKLKLAGAERLSALEIGPKEFAVRVRDHHTRVKLRFEASFPVQLRGRALQLASGAEQFERDIFNAVGVYFQNEVGLHQFEREMAGSVAAGLRERLEEVAARWGREVGHLQLASASPVAGVRDSQEVKWEFKRELPEYPEPVEIKTKFLLVLRDVGAYVAAGSPALEPWARTMVEDAARRVLFSSRYTELVHTVDAKKDQIKKVMTDAARAIGYEIQQFIAITNLQVDRLREPFSVVVVDTFATRVPNVTVGLDVRVTARIPDTRAIARYLDRREDVVGAMIAATRDEVADVLHDIDPEEFYLYFNAPMPAKPAEAAESAPRATKGADTRPLENVRKSNETVQRFLMRKIVERLASFGAEITQIVFKNSDDAITGLLGQLRQQQRKFEIEVVPRGGKSLPIVFDAVVIVNAVDPRGWHNFLTIRPTMDTVVESVRMTLKGSLAEVDVMQLRNNLESDLIPEVNRWARKRVGNQFGLNVEVTHLHRKPMLDEIATGKVITKAIETKTEMEIETIETAKRLNAGKLDIQVTQLEMLKSEYKALESKLHSAADVGADERDEFIRRRAAILIDIEKLQISNNGVDHISAVFQGHGLGSLQGSGRGLPAGARDPDVVVLKREDADENKR